MEINGRAIPNVVFPTLNAVAEHYITLSQQTGYNYLDAKYNLNRTILCGDGDYHSFASLADKLAGEGGTKFRVPTYLYDYLKENYPDYISVDRGFALTPENEKDKDSTLFDTLVFQVTVTIYKSEQTISETLSLKVKGTISDDVTYGHDGEY